MDLKSFNLKKELIIMDINKKIKELDLTGTEFFKKIITEFINRDDEKLLEIISLNNNLIDLYSKIMNATCNDLIYNRDARCNIYLKYYKKMTKYDKKYFLDSLMDYFYDKLYKIKKEDINNAVLLEFREILIEYFKEHPKSPNGTVNTDKYNALSKFLLSEKEE